jgi:hypothetical protein
MGKAYRVSHANGAEPELYEICVRSDAELSKISGLKETEFQDGMTRYCYVTYDPETRFITPDYSYQPNTPPHTVERAIFEKFGVEANAEVRAHYERHKDDPRPSPEKFDRAESFNPIGEFNSGDTIGPNGEIIPPPSSFRRWPHQWPTGLDVDLEVGSVPAAPSRLGFQPSPEGIRALREQARPLAADPDDKPLTREDGPWSDKP